MTTTIKRRYDEVENLLRSCYYCASGSEQCIGCSYYEHFTFMGVIRGLLDHIKALEDAYFGAPEDRPTPWREAMRRVAKASTSSEALKHVLPSVAIRENANRIAKASEILTEHLPGLDKDAYIQSAYMRDSGAVFFVKVGEKVTNMQCHTFAKDLERVLLQAIPALTFAQITFM